MIAIERRQGMAGTWNPAKSPTAILRRGELANLVVQASRLHVRPLRPHRKDMRPRWPQHKHVRPALAAPQTCAARVGRTANMCGRVGRNSDTCGRVRRNTNTCSRDGYTTIICSRDGYTTINCSRDGYTTIICSWDGRTASTCGRDGRSTNKRLSYWQAFDRHEYNAPRRPRADFEVRSEGPALIADQSASALGRDALAVPPPPARHPQPLSHCDEKMRGEGSKSAARRSPAPVRLAGKGPRPRGLPKSRPFRGQGSKSARAAGTAHCFRPSVGWEIRGVEKSVFRLIQNRKSKIQNPKHPSEVDRAAKLREIPPSNQTARILADAPSRRRDVQEITQRVGERTALAGRRFGVRSAAFEVRSAEFGSRSAKLNRVNSQVHTIGRSLLAIGAIRTGRSRRAAGMFDFGSARALSLGSIYQELGCRSRSLFSARRNSRC